MHELSIALNLVQIAEAAARRAEVDRMTEVPIVVGALSGVAPEEAVQLAHDGATWGMLLEVEP